MAGEAQKAPPKRITLDELFSSAVALHQKNDFEGAAKLYRLYLAKAPGHARGWTNLGSLLRKQGRYEASVAAHRRALALNPELENAKNNLANALVDLGQYAEAIRLREELLAQAPKDRKRIRDLAIALRGDWQHQRVIDMIDAAEAEAPFGEDGELGLQRALSHLTLGNYAEGFADFEYRYFGTEVSLPKEVPWPRWQGEDLSGKRLLILPEQGFGDAILMARFIPKLAEMGAEVSMVVKPPLQRLFEGLQGVKRLISHARKTDEFDYYTPNMSLPHLVGMDDGAIPPLPAFNIPGPSRRRARNIVGPFDGMLKVGIVWTGSLTYKANHRRSTTPESFLPLCGVPGVQLFSLYKGEDHERFLNSGMAGLIVDACGDDADFADSAAIIDEMDLMITTDTAVVHIAASLGKPVWNMLNHEGFWLYGQEETTPWYPSMRIFRQKEAGDWSNVIMTVEQELREYQKTRGQ